MKELADMAVGIIVFMGLVVAVVLPWVLIALIFKWVLSW